MELIRGFIYLIASIVGLLLKPKRDGGGVEEAVADDELNRPSCCFHLLLSRSLLQMPTKIFVQISEINFLLFLRCRLQPLLLNYISVCRGNVVIYAEYRYFLPRSAVTNWIRAELRVYLWCVFANRTISHVLRAKPRSDDPHYKILMKSQSLTEMGPIGILHITNQSIPYDKYMQIRQSILFWIWTGYICSSRMLSLAPFSIWNNKI